MKPSGGFTFVELMIASTMIAVLFVGLGGHLRAGMRVWQQATTTSNALQQQRVVFERLERDLTNAFVYTDGRTDLPLPPTEFRADRMRWCTVVGSGTSPAIELVTYTCDQEGFRRHSQSIGEARKAQQPREEVLVPECETLTLRYAYLTPSGPAPSTVASDVLEWRDQWTQADELPRLIEMTLACPPRELRRLFAIPVGVLKEWGQSP